jgi:Carbohydrate phosphorylase
VPDPRFEEVKEFVRNGAFGTHNYEELMGSLEGNEGYGRADYFLVGKDFPSYIECQMKVDEAYRDQKVSQFLLLVKENPKYLVPFFFSAAGHASQYKRTEYFCFLKQQSVLLFEEHYRHSFFTEAYMIFHF